MSVPTLNSEGGKRAAWCDSMMPSVGQNRPEIVIEGIYRVTGADKSDYRDSCSYLLDFGDPVLIDGGSGFGFEEMTANVQALAIRPTDIRRIILTHCHFDHIGGAFLYRHHFGSAITMHELDAEVVERGDNRLTAAFCFGVRIGPLPVDVRLHGSGGTLQAGSQDVHWLHTPGHSAGSISLYLDREGSRIVFVQDIGAPLLADFDCDPQAWRSSVEKLITLDGDILCDGHSGVYRSKSAVRQYLGRCIEAVTRGNG